jgi:hypothetical protein
LKLLKMAMLLAPVPNLKPLVNNPPLEKNLLPLVMNLPLNKNLQKNLLLELPLPQQLMVNLFKTLMVLLLINRLLFQVNNQLVKKLVKK